MKKTIAQRFPACSHRSRNEANADLLAMLRVMELLSGMRFRFTSGVRCASCNKSVGGSRTSEHLSGHAVDIFIRSSRERIAVARAALQAGCNRIGVYEKFVHVGIDKEHPQNVLWIG